VDNSTVQRYRCVGCAKTYSDATHSLAYKQQRRDINLRAFLSLSAVLSLRRISMHLGVSRGTLHRRLGFFEAVARQAHQDLLVRLKTAGEEFKYIQFDDH
jgi:transposase-like protein